MVLLEQQVPLAGRQQELVDALPELRIAVRVEIRPDAPVLCLPGGAAIGRMECSDGGDADPDAPGVDGIHGNGVQDEAPLPRLPFGRRRVVAQA